MTYVEELRDVDLLRSIWVALRRIETALAVGLRHPELPAPVVTVIPPEIDLGAIVTAVTGLKPGPSAEEIARAIATVLTPSSLGAASEDGVESLAAVARALEKLDFRLKGMGTQAFGGGSVSLLSNQTVGVTGLPDLTGAWSYYAGASGTVNVASGERVVGIAAHATTSGSMTIAGGSSVPLPANSGIQFSPQGNLVGPVAVVFTGTDSYAVEVLGA